MRLTLLLLLMLVLQTAHAIEVSGTITRLADAQPAVGAQVTLVQQVSPFQQVQLGQVTVGADGAYAFSFANTGSFYVRATLAPLLPAEEFVAFPAGSPPLVVDIALSAPATIAAVVRDAVTQAPLANTPVAFYRAPGNFPTEVVTDGDGRAVLGNVAGGDYRVCARSLTDAYVDECQDGQQLPLTGNLAGIAPRAIGSGVDLELPIALDAGASIAGRVTDRYYGIGATAPIRFEFFDAAGTALAQTDLPLSADGSYAMRGLPAGTYRVTARGFASNYYTRRVYPDLDCDPCDVTLGTAITLGTQQAASEIDFALHPGVVVTGTVREAGSLLPIPAATVRIYRQQVIPPGPWFEIARGTTAADGTYSLAHIDASDVRMAATVQNSFAQTYGGPVCYFEPCGTGTTIPVVPDQVVSGIDVLLTQAGTITATIRGARSGEALDGTIWIAAAGGGISYNASAPRGPFQTYGLPPGTYFAAASRFRNGVRDCVAHQGQPCLPGDPIDPATATPIVVAASGTQAIELVLPDDLLADGFE